MQTSQASALRPIRFGALFKPERGKFYFFSPSDGILVVRPWPVLKAWRKTPKRCFKQVRVDISLDDPPHILPVSRRSGPRTGLPTPVPSEEELCTLIAEWPVGTAEDDKAQPQAIRGVPYTKRWHAESELRHRKVCRAFAESFPPDIRKSLAPFGSRQWHLAKLAQLDGGLDLINTNPGLAFCLASSWVFKRSAHPWRTARRLLSLKRRDAAGWLGFPATESVVRLLGRVAPEACYAPLVLNLRRAVNGGLAPELVDTLRFLPVLNADTLTLINSRTMLPRLTPAFIRDVARRSVHPGCTGEWRDLMVDVQRMLQLLPDTPPPGPLHSLAAYRRYHDALACQYNERVADETQEPLDDGSPLPPPPFPGTSEIIPLSTPQEVHQEGVEQRSCVAAYLDKVRRGHTFIYRVLAPQRATAEIAEQQPGRWHLVQLAGFKNRSVSKATSQALDEWLAAAHRQSVIISDEEVSPASRSASWRALAAGAEAERGTDSQMQLHFQF